MTRLGSYVNAFELIQVFLYLTTTLWGPWVLLQMDLGSAIMVI